MADLIDGMIEAALCASEVILDIYDGEIEVDIKGDETPVTKADQAAEKVIVEHLTKLAPTVPIVAEEAVAAGHIPEIGNEFFLVDPVDGTKEFIKRNGEFTVNIALIRNNIPVLGVIHTPAKGWLFAGDMGKGAFRAQVADPRICHDRQATHSISVRAAGTAVDVVGSRSHQSTETARYLEQYPIGEHKCIGSSLKFCLLAAGEADLYPRFGRTMEWDTAAGDAILTAAGGSVRTLEDQRLQYGKTINQDAPFANPNFIARGMVS